MSMGQVPEPSGANGSQPDEQGRCCCRISWMVGLGVVIVLAGAYAVLELAGVGVRDLLTARTSRPATSRQSGAGTSQAAGSGSRQWATPLDLPGLPNLHKVSEGLYRGAQPTAGGMRQLEKLGVKTVINLRSFHSDRDELEGTLLDYEHITMKAWHPEDEETRRFLRIVTDPARTPVFVHCMHGADRTGTMCAIYRMAVQGWGVEEAIEEMTKGGFGYHEAWGNLLEYLRKLDLDAVRPDGAGGG